MESDVVTLQDIFVAQPPDGGRAPAPHRLLSPLRATGLKPHFLEKLAANNVVLPPVVLLGSTTPTRSVPSFAATPASAGHE